MPGYKHSDVGVIPDDWDAVPLSQTAKRITRGASPRPIDSPVWFDSRSSVGWVRISDVTRSGRYLMETTQRLSEEGIRRSRPVPSGSLIMSICATVGRPIETRIDTCIHDGFVVFDQPSIDQSYLYHVLAALEPTWSKHGQTGSQMNLNTGLINSCLIPLPPTETEQRAIAQALSDADELLAALDQMIVKKLDLKKATLQQLLTGETRLPGFDGEWLEKSLSNTATLKARIGWQGLTTAEYLDVGDYLLVTGTDFKNSNIDWQNCHYVTEERYSQDKNIQLKLNDVLVTKDGTIGKVALISELPSPATLNSGVFVIRPIRDAFHPNFFYFLLCSKVFTEFLNELCAGSTISHLYQKDFITFKYRTPPTLSEQNAISKVLSDMDAELSALEIRREKALNIKQAMMQELLTGKTRLV